MSVTQKLLKAALEHMIIKHPWIKMGSVTANLAMVHRMSKYDMSVFLEG